MYSNARIHMLEFVNLCTQMLEITLSNVRNPYPCILESMYSNARIYMLECVNPYACMLESIHSNA
jgi:hypothetical protein